MRLSLLIIFLTWTWMQAQELPSFVLFYKVSHKKKSGTTDLKTQAPVYVSLWERESYTFRGDSLQYHHTVADGTTGNSKSVFLDTAMRAKLSSLIDPSWIEKSEEILTPSSASVNRYTLVFNYNFPENPKRGLRTYEGGPDIQNKPGYSAMFVLRNQLRQLLGLP